jgi:hypothetical protein
MRLPDASVNSLNRAFLFAQTAARTLLPVNFKFCQSLANTGAAPTVYHMLLIFVTEIF